MSKDDDRPSLEAILSDLPWDEDKLARAAMAGFRWDGPILKKLKGYKYASELEALNLSVRILDRSVKSLEGRRGSFSPIQPGQNSFVRGLPPKNTRDAVFKVQVALFGAAAATTAYKDRAATLHDRLQIPGFDQEAETKFYNREQYQFIQALRNHLSHVAPIEAEWHLSRPLPASPEGVQFLLYVTRLDELSSQSKHTKRLAMAFVDKHRGSSGENLGGGGAIDIVALFKAQQAEMHDFYAWLTKQVENKAGQKLSAYREAKENFHRVVARMEWRAVGLPWIKGSNNPRAVVDHFLTREEIGQIDTLPLCLKGADRPGSKTSRRGLPWVFYPRDARHHSSRIDAFMTEP